MSKELKASIVDAVVDNKESELKLVEAFVKKLVRPNEKPGFARNTYAKNVFSNSYRVNFYNEKTEKIRSMFLKVIDGEVKVIDSEE